MTKASAMQGQCQMKDSGSTCKGLPHEEAFPIPIAELANATAAIGSLQEDALPGASAARTQYR